ncbi:hypothetical protein ACKXGF_02825 [Alkalibacillus sp. S2W]|uniref:hypothetical protein n=1 Tax=Alkalibacillus sp. S2W TaxID=3386553 RepID=UPI00398C8A75
MLYIKVIMKYKWSLLFVYTMLVAIAITLFLKVNLTQLLSISPDEELLTFISRFLIIQITVTITIYSFVYKEKKEASYSNLRNSRINNSFIITVLLSFLTLFFSLITMYSISPDSNGSNFFINTFIFWLISITMLGLYLWFLFSDMDISNALKRNLKKTKNYQELITDIANQEGKFLLNYSHILQDYNTIVESNFQLIISLIEKNKFSDIEVRQFDLYQVTNEIHSEYVHNSDLISFYKFLNSKTNKKELINLYKNVLLNYKLLIRTASKHKMTNLQKKAYKEFLSLSPIKLYKSDLRELEDKEFKLLWDYYDELTSEFFTSQLDILKEFSNESTIENSFFIEQLNSNETLNEFLLEMSTIEKNNEKDYKNKDRLYRTFIDETYNFLESVIMWAVEEDQIKFLTESTSMLLDYYYTHIQNADYQIKNIRKQFSDSNEETFLEDFISKNKNYYNHNIYSNNSIFKELVWERTNFVMIEALYKSIEIGHYRCSGYIIKIVCTHFKFKNMLDFLNTYLKRSVFRENQKSDSLLHHSTINKHSFVHCFQKLVVLLSYQMFFKHTLDDEIMNKLTEMIKIIFLNNRNDLYYILDKIDQAKDKYGMVSIAPSQRNKILNLI